MRAASWRYRAALASSDSTPDASHRRVLSKYGTDDCDYEDHRSNHEQPTDGLFVQGTGAMIAARIVF
jgi:hypothetical protein